MPWTVSWVKTNEESHEMDDDKEQNIKNFLFLLLMKTEEGLILNNDLRLSEELMVKIV